MKILLIYLLVVNAIGFILMRTDKHRAINNRWRIRENTLIFVGVIGGSLGLLAGMHIFHHKTLRPKFQIGLPLIFALQVVGYMIYFLQIR